jgi:tripartite-type tricarboxylate transporter receptor subunit TctC
MKKRWSFTIRLSLALTIIGSIFFPDFLLAAYPEKSVTYICVFSAGGSNDIMARNIAETMKRYFPKPVVVVNRPGAGGSIGTAEVIQSRPDGYVIGHSTMTSLTIQPHRQSLPYDTPDDYTPIARVGGMAWYVMVPYDSSLNTFSDLIEYAKANPGKLRMGHYGIGHLSHLILEDLKQKAKIDLTLVPYPGGGEAVAAILGKHIEASLGGPQEVIPQVQAKKVKLLAVCDEKRNPLFPEVPTFKEMGLNITDTTYSVVIGPKGLSIEVVSKLDEALRNVSKDPNFLDFMQRNGFFLPYEGPKDVSKRIWEDYKRYGGLLERLGLKKK